ncbi:MAG: hypothetical protein H6842_03335 [Rhodospirillaceae bacterium]|nr:hypothetical protein [Rhodospirillaceae bacterium]
MTQTTFTTSFGDTITLDGQYRQWVGKPVRADSPTHLYEVQYAKAAPPLGLGAFSYKHYEACMIYDALRRAGIGLDFQSMLDIGSGFAAMPRITWVRNYARDVTALDLFPYGVTALSNALVRRRLTEIALAQRSGLRNLRGPMGKWEWVVSRENFALPPVSSSGRFDYQVANVYELEGQFDWINSSLTLTHFNHADLFAKIASLLGDGGVFTFTVECWWYPVNSTQITGAAPWLCQRLTRDDLLRYFRECEPEVDGDHVAAVYDYYADPAHPTASDYVATAVANDLHPVIVERHMNARSWSKRASLAPPWLKRETGQGALEALENIRRFKPGVIVEDLYTSHYLLGFRKVARGNS